MKPAEYDSPIVDYDTHVQMVQDAYDSGYRRGCKDTVDRVIKILHRRQEPLEKKETRSDWEQRLLEVLEAVECEVMVMEGME